MLFKSGERVYDHDNVPQSLFEELTTCESCGKFYFANFKGKYPREGAQ